jgi:hypothetical protein
VAATRLIPDDFLSAIVFDSFGRAITLASAQYPGNFS